MRIRAVLVGVALLTSVCPAAVASAGPVPQSASTPAAPVAAVEAAADVSVFVDRAVLPPGSTTTIHVGTWDWLTFTPLSGARFSSTDRAVLRVNKKGTLRALAPGTASVTVTLRGQQWSVPVQVRQRALWTLPSRVGNLCNCDVSLLNGHGFAPGSPITFSTNGVEGVYVSGEATADATGAFLGSIAPDGYIETGPALVVDHAGDAGVGGCEDGSTWVVTATDARGTSERLSGTC